MDILNETIYNESLPLIIAFGGIAGGLTIPVFEFKKFLLSKFKCHFIFIRDINQTWYLNESIENSVTIIKSYIDKINYSKIITLGISMGGFASILFGTLLNVNNILAFCPQTFIDFENRKKYRDTRWENIINKIYLKDINKNYYDLSLLDFSKDTNIKIFYGKLDNLDKIHSLKLKDKNNIIIEECEGDHSFFKILKDNNKLYEIIHSLI
jgi:hypothetical protein